MEGRFVLAGVPPGAHRLTASRNGFISNARGKFLALAPGQSVSNITVKLTPEGVVTGRVVDEDGEPMRNIAISLQQHRYIEGRRRLFPSSTTTTNDLGAVPPFRPGARLIRAQCGAQQPAVSRHAPQRAAERRSLRDNVLSGTTDVSAATPVRVSAGAQLRGLDLTMTKSRTFHVRGRVVHGMGRPNVSIVQLAARGSGFLSGMRASPVNPAGAFDIGAVTPGAYTLFATFNDSTGARRAKMTLEVGGADVDGLQLAALSDTLVKGRIVSDLDAPPVPLAGVRVMLQPVEFDMMSGGTSQTRPDEQGDFEINQVPADHYLLFVSGLPVGAYVKSARTDRTDVLASGLDLSAGSAPASLAVMVGPRGATVSGVVQPAGATVVLIPQDERRALSFFYKTAVADANGAFSLAGVAPGDYLLYA